MKIDKFYAPEKVVAKGKGANPNLTDPYLDVRRRRLVATNGHALVALPVETEPDERSGYKAVPLLKAARKFGSPDVPAEIEDEKIVDVGVLWPTMQEGRQFPDWHDLAPKFRRGSPGTVSIGFHAGKLAQLAAAMGAEQIVITFEPPVDDHSPGPILVQTPSDRDDSPFGILMPIRLGDEVDPGQKCAKCGRLLAAGASCPDCPPAEGGVAEAVGELKKVLAESGATMTVRVGDGPARTFSAKKPEPEPLFWDVDDGKQVASVAGGRYLLTSAKAGGFTATWEPLKGKSRMLEIGKPLEVAREACRKHHVERHADALLRNAGADELTRNDTKGEAVARKRK